MSLRIPSFLLLISSVLSAQGLIEPFIVPNGVENAASYTGPGFPNSGIAQGSLFLIFGQQLGPGTLVQATTFPLPTSAGLAGTSVQISSGSYIKPAIMVYTSDGQVAAILPSDAPLGDATLTLSYKGLTSNAVTIHIVRSSFGVFTLNQAGLGPAIVQNATGANTPPTNSLIASAHPGQTEILWGTGLGPVAGDEAAGPLPGNLNYVSSVYVGGQQATVTYSGRSGCCAGVDQINFIIPQGVSGCYVPVAVQTTNGTVSNFGTIAVSASGNECDDPLTFRAAQLSAAEQAGRLHSAQVSLIHSSPAGGSGTNNLTASFLSYPMATLVQSLVPLTPSLGSCYMTELNLRADLGALPHGTPLNAGGVMMESGPSGSLNAQAQSLGSFSATVTPADLPAGAYSIFGGGGGDVGPYRANFNVTSPLQWTNSSAYNGASLLIGSQPLTFTWSADPNGYVTISIAANNPNIETSVVCNAPASAGSFTVPDFIARSIIAAPATFTVNVVDAPIPFTATGLDLGTVTVGTTASVNGSFRAGLSTP
ncbi:MAG TPA: hypothetical protein VG675_20700 [Bryobacteraceae bacterium]|nr:hypothetical protein [Bryobacteraceae bacterium]